MSAPHTPIVRHPSPLALTPLLLAILAVGGTAHAADGWSSGGDLRVGFVASESQARNGRVSDAESVRARLRLHLRGEIGNGWKFSGRLATRLDSEQDGMRFWLKPHAPTSTGLGNGQATIDDLHVEYRTPDSPWSLRLGRFQAAFAPADLMKKSLDLNDSPNFDITWTDGAWLQWRGSEWTSHAIVRYIDRRGPGNTLRAPLAFTDDSSRLGLFLATESRAQKGPVVQRMLTMTWLPSALHPDGADQPAREDYLAVTAKGALQWPLGDGPRKLLLGGEIGHALNTPRREVMGSGTGRADALSWQASATLVDVFPGHSVGLVHGRVADGWLLSNDFRPNNSLLEARWVWRVDPSLQLDARLRRRKEIDLPEGTAQPRRDDDLYVRATWRF